MAPVHMSAFKTELCANLRVIGMITGLAFGGVGAAMLATQLHTDLSWRQAEAEIKGIGVVCDLESVEWRLSRNARRPHYATLACSDVESRRRQNPDIAFEVKEVPNIAVRFTTATGHPIETFGRFNPDSWAIPKVGDRVSIRYNPDNPQDVAWTASARWMYPMAGVFEMIAVALWWRGGRNNSLPPTASVVRPDAARVPGGGSGGRFGRRGSR